MPKPLPVARRFLDLETEEVIEMLGYPTDSWAEQRRHRTRVSVALMRSRIQEWLSTKLAETRK